MPIGPVRWLRAAWDFGRQVDDIIKLNETTQQAISQIETKLRVIEDRLLRLESEQIQIIVEAKSAAAAAATTTAAGALFEAATRIARLEIRLSTLLDRSALPSPLDKP